MFSYLNIFWWNKKKKSWKLFFHWEIYRRKISKRKLVFHVTCPLRASVDVVWWFPLQTQSPLFTVIRRLCPKRLTVIQTLMMMMAAMTTRTPGTVWGSVSHPKTFWHADEENQTSNLQITWRHTHTRTHTHTYTWSHNNHMFCVCVCVCVCPAGGAHQSSGPGLVPDQVPDDADRRNPLRVLGGQ